MTGHTPWELKDQNCHGSVHIVNSLGRKVARVMGDRDERPVRGALMTAARELLEALKAFLLSENTEPAFYCDYCCEQAETDADGNIVGPVRHALGCPDPIARLVILKAEGGGDAI